MKQLKSYRNHYSNEEFDRTAFKRDDVAKLVESRYYFQ